MHKKIIILTDNLLKAGVFKHLSDDEVSRLHWLLTESKLPSFDKLEILVRAWYRGDYYSQGVPQYLLHQCNECLSAMRLPMIEAGAGEYLDA